MKKVIFICAVIVAILSALTFRDVIFLHDGEEVRCNVKEIDNKTILAETPDGVKKFSKSDVVRLTMTHPRPGDNWNTIKDIDDSLLLATIERASEAKKYPMASSITLYHSISYTFDSDSSCRETVRKIILILNERGKNMNSTSLFHFVSPNQTGDIDFCRTIIPADSSVYHLDDAALEFAEPNSFNPQYNFLRRVKFAPPQMSIGAIIDYQYHIDQKVVDPTHPLAAKVIFGESEPIIHKELKISIPKNIPKSFIKYYSFSPPVQKTDEGVNIYLWEKDDISPTVHENWQAPFEMFLPTVWVGFGIDEGKLLKALSDSFNVALDGSNQLDAFIDSLTRNAKTPMEKFDKIYEYLDISFRKAYVPPSNSRWFPRKVSDIFDDGIANSLDLNTLMCYILEHIGIESQLVMASNIVDKSAISDVPSLSFFGSPLVAAKIDGKWIFANPMSKYSPPDIIPSNLAGQQALWVGKSSVQMAELPNNPLNVYTNTDTLWVSLEPNGDADVEEKIVYGLANGIGVKYYNETPKEQLDKNFQTSAGDFHPGATLVDYSIIGLNGLDSNAVIIEKISAPSLAQTAGKKLLAFQVPELEYKAGGFGQPTRNTPIWHSSPSVNDRVWIIKLPEKYEPDYIPEPLSIKLDSLKYDLTFNYDKGNRTLTVTEHSERTDRFVPAEDYPELRAAMFQRAKASKKWIVLEK